ncbi:MAG: Tryptophan--tRNA ligase [Puniceicoccaceae bacterium MED-G32]|jgi:tryptophanyl-tRNA synthetase|nr:tryptophan--tRNA ligase [Puniceicoccaceae bacterium]CAI8263524.1 MAG: Tryptophan--tRNA ligase [Puniceicoccaceae bacterium MED-G32]|tara:strand:+ start:2030 stop:3073 length:1044 start_codon:yes stop_codon:yes gene_type:complete
MSDTQPVILTCAQPTGGLTIGNYLGAIRNWADMLESNHCFFGIVDLHAITVEYTPSELRKNTLSCVAQYIACGLDPKKSNIFVQSHITGHTELAWILSCITPLGELQRMTQFKDKTRHLNDDYDSNANDDSQSKIFVNSGLLMYPVLMAADILLYNANSVPVGADQKQHLEICRNLAQRFNHKYSDTFNIPEPYIAKQGQRIMSLQDPNRKMSKSDVNQNATLFLLDDSKVIRKKIMSAVTDSSSEIEVSTDKPGVTNLLNIYSSFNSESPQAIAKKYAGKGYGDLKSDLADLIISKLSPVQERYYELMKDKEYLESVLKEGAENAQKLAYKTLRKVYKKTGFLNRF